MSSNSIYETLQNVFMRKGHDEATAKDLAFEALELIEDWYEEKMEGVDDEEF